MHTLLKPLRHQYYQQIRQLQAEEKTMVQTLAEQYKSPYEQLDSPSTRAVLLATYVRKLQQLRRLYAQKRQRLVKLQEKKQDNLTKKLIGSDEWERRQRLIRAGQTIKAAKELVELARRLNTVRSDDQRT